MRIDSDTSSFSNAKYGQSHTHHITECLHEDEKAKNNAGAMGIKKDTFTGKGGQENSVADPTGISYTTANRRAGGLKFGKGYIKGLWDSMGDEGTSGKAGSSMRHKNDQGGINALTSVIKQGFPNYIINKWEVVRDKVKVEVTSALRRFGKGGGSFSALSNMASGSGNQNSMENGFAKDDEKSGTRSGKTDMITAIEPDHHLMDSYNKAGSYCRLNENLSYQKKSSPKQSTEDEEVLDNDR